MKDHGDTVTLSREQWAQVQDLKRQFAAMQKPLSAADCDRITSLRARVDTAFQRCGDEAPTPLAGEQPAQYQKRILARAQKYTRFKDQTATYFHDSIVQLPEGPALDLMFEKMVDDMRAYSKNPPSGTRLRPIRTESNGHTRTEWVGDANECWAPFEQPTRFFVTSLGPPPKP